MENLLYIGIISFLFTGCSLQKETVYHADPLEIPTAEKSLLCESETNSVTELTASLEIADLLDIALRNNPQTKKVWADIRASFYSIGVAKSNLYPSLTFGEVAAYTDLKFTHLPPGQFATGPGSTTLAGYASNQNTPVIITSSGPVGYSKIIIHGLAFSWLLLDFGAIDANINSAKELLYATQLTGNRTIQQVMVTVLRNYYQYNGQKALVEAKIRDIENDRASLELSEQQYVSGIETKLDVLQARSALVNNESSLGELKGSKEIAWANLMASLGLPVTSHIKIKDFPDDIPLDTISENVDALVKIAQEERSDLTATFATYRKALNEVVISESNGLPTLTAQAGWQRTLFNNNPSFNQTYTAAAVVLQFPLFTGFLHFNEAKRSRAYAIEAYEDYERMKLTVTLDVVKSYYDYNTAVDRVKYSDELLIYTQQAYDFAFDSYRLGVTSIIDLLVAQKNLARARAEKIQARTQWAIALANISFATGVLSC